MVDVTFTYGAQPNLFKALSLFDVAGRLGSDDIFNLFTFFNSNVLTSFKTNGIASTSAYTFNGSQLPAKVVTNDVLNGDLFTWQFSYK